MQTPIRSRRKRKRSRTKRNYPCGRRKNCVPPHPASPSCGSSPRRQPDEMRGDKGSEQNITSAQAARELVTCRIRPAGERRRPAVRSRPLFKGGLSLACGRLRNDPRSTYFCLFLYFFSCVSLSAANGVMILELRGKTMRRLAVRDPSFRK